MRSFTAWVSGEPRPKGSKRIARGRLIESSRGLDQWNAALDSTLNAFRAKDSWETIYGPASVRINFFTARMRVDLDKLCRAVLDALVRARILGDDSQVCALTATKFVNQTYTGALITVRPIK